MNIFKGIVLPVLTAGTMSVAAYGDGVKANDTVQTCKELFAKEYWQVKKEKHFNAAYEICTKNKDFRIEVLSEKCKELDGQMSGRKTSDGTLENQYCKTKWGNLTENMLTRDDFINIDETPRH
ncbi:MAG: hypothetical protein AB7U51_01415 [Arcobacter sp.]|uniref:hypothetical protein n=1 Tax=Arcobacter sp. TaxID=1872629 RepID=UPI003D013A28